MNQGAHLSIFQKQMYRAANDHPAAMADADLITFDDFQSFQINFCSQTHTQPALACIFRLESQKILKHLPF